MMSDKDEKYVRMYKEGEVHPRSRMKAWDVYNQLFARWETLQEKFGDKTLTEDEIKVNSLELKHISEAMKEDLLEKGKKLMNGSLKFSDLIPEEFLPKETKRRKRSERYKKKDPEEQYNFAKALEKKNLKKRLFDYFRREGFSI